MHGVSGLFAPIITPFTDDAGAISEVRLARVVQRYKQVGIGGFVACSDTGEFTSLTFAERKQFLEILIREAQGLPVITHATTLSTSACIDLAQHAARHGARAAAVMPPYYGQFTEDEIYTHFANVAHYASLPIVVVDPQARITPSLFERLASVPGLIWPSPVQLFAGSEAAMSRGCSSDEMNLGDACVTPVAIALLFELEIIKKHVEPLALWLKSYGAMRVCKAAFELLDVPVGPLRGPYQSLTKDQLAQVRAALPEL